MDYNLIVRPLVGAVIGYSTNWLAIKMLFKPHEEKKIGGIRIPFTPGVIPRERNRIAKSLGSAVGEQLLTEEVIANELLNDRVIDHIKKYVIKDLLEKDISLEDLLQVILKNETGAVMSGFSRTIVTEIGMYMNNPESKEALRKNISGYVSEAVPYDTVIGELFNDHMAEEVNGLVRNNIDGIGNYLVNLASSDAVKRRLSEAIETLVMEKVGALGAMFLDGPSMAESVVAYVESLLTEEEVQEGLIAAINGGVTTLREQNISETVSLGLYLEVINSMTNQVMEGLYSRMDETLLMSVVTPLVDKIVKRKIHLSDHEKEMIEGQVEVLYRGFIQKNISTFLESFEVSKIVEGEINNFEVKDIEQLIFAIIDKELNAITWIGGLLGFVIGMVYVFV